MRAGFRPDPTVCGRAGAAVALAAGVIHLSDIPVVWHIVWNATGVPVTFLSGGQTTTNAAGQSSMEVRAGDSFVVPAGFAGTWQVLERARKLYVILEPGEQAVTGG